MRRNISLWLDGQRADIDNDTLIQFNYQQSDLSNPTVVRNSYSQTVVLPATPTNNRIFGSYYRLDRVSNPYNFGPQFDAMRRTPFAIYDEKQTLLESGYFRLEDVKRNNGGVYSYSIALYGGLGGFFYKLTAKEDGTSVNLGDLTYKSYNGAVQIRPNDATEKITLSADVVAECMHNVGAIPSSSAPFRWFLSFAPCYNGIPEGGFDAKKAMIKRDDFYDCGSGGYAVITMANARTEWEIRDLRAWLQRPVVNVLEIVKAIAVDGYTFTYSDGVADALADVWITLKQMNGEHVFERSGDARRYAFSALFEDSPAPAAVLTSLAKQFGFVFECDNLGNVAMRTRAEMFAGGISMDLSARIDWSKEMVTKPYSFDAKYYVFSNDVAEGGYAKEYKERYGKSFGQQLVN
ncbi:MAG: hypothetical protein KBS70_08740, partial [Bacteroidales bacterium]|nr:hypothetical protein [Candidatus Colicola equi]